MISTWILEDLDSSNNIHSRINITTLFNFPDMFRRYFEIAVEFNARAILQSSLHCVVNIAY